MQIDIAAPVGRGYEGSQRSRARRASRRGSWWLSRPTATTAEDLWEAITTADRLPRWLMPITGDLRLGGRYQLQGNAGGEILICEPPKHLNVTWEYGGEISWVDAKIAGRRTQVRAVDGRAHRACPTSIGSSSGPARSASAGT